jgi:hypothetical protein
MSNCFVKSILVSAFALVILPAYAQDEIKAQYRASYVHQMKPMLVQHLQSSFPNKTPSEIDAYVNTQAQKMADCQLGSISHYPTKYWDASVRPVAKGKSLTEVREEINALLQADVNAGVISVDTFQAMVAQAAESYKQCLSR